MPDYISIGAFRYVYRNYKSNANKRNIEFLLSESDVINLTSKPCFYCGLSPYTIQKSHTKLVEKYIYNGIDRIDNNIGYTKDNVVTCCTFCNRMKSNMSLKEFLQHIELISDHQNKRDRS